MRGGLLGVGSHHSSLVARRRRSAGGALVVRCDGLEQMGEALARLLAARWQVLGRDFVGGRGVAVEDLARDGLAVDLIGPS